jgi:hypothetical protein
MRGMGTSLARPERARKRDRFRSPGTFIFTGLLNQLGVACVFHAKAGSVSCGETDETKLRRGETIFRLGRRRPETGHGY